MFDYTTPAAEGGIDFRGWPKIPRDRGGFVTITEKIDGTNACVIVRDGEVVGCQSRNRLIKPGDDNMGFAFWVVENAEELAECLGDGYHYGEWAGPGIQSNPRLLERKTFYLFNHSRRPFIYQMQDVETVPVLYEGVYSRDVVEFTMLRLWGRANYIPEGIVIFHHDTRTLSKITFENSDGKWKQGN